MMSMRSKDFSKCFCGFRVTGVFSDLSSDPCWREGRCHLCCVKGRGKPAGVKGQFKVSV